MELQPNAISAFLMRPDTIFPARSRRAPHGWLVARCNTGAMRNTPKLNEGARSVFALCHQPLKPTTVPPIRKTVRVNDPKNKMLLQ